MAACARCASLPPRRICCHSQGGITHHGSGKGKPEHAVTRSLPQGHLLKAGTALLAGVSSQHTLSPKGSTGKALLTALLSRDSTLNKGFVFCQKTSPSALSLRMLPLQSQQGAACQGWAPGQHQWGLGHKAGFEQWVRHKL